MPVLLPDYVKNKIQQDSVERLDQKIVVVKYGDGYEQRASIGVNSKFTIWQIRAFPLTESEKISFTNFWNNHGFVNSWKWTPPQSIQERFWVFNTPPEFTNIAEFYELSFEAREVFE